MKQNFVFEIVSVIFPVHNGGTQPVDCVKSLYKSNYPKRFLEIIIIDNGSTDGSIIRIKKKYPEVKIITLKNNLGFAKAVNKGIRQSYGKYLLITNDDIIFEKNSLKYLVKYASNNSLAGILGGKIFSKKSPHQILSCGYKMSHYTGHIYAVKNCNQLFDPDWIQGCALFTKKTLLKKIGLFDENFSYFFEDNDLCLRAHSAGYMVRFIPQVKFWHGESLTADKNKPVKYYHWYRNKFRFIIKHLPVFNVVCILIIQLIIIMPVRTLIFHDGRFVPFIAGLFWNIKHFSATYSLRNK